MPKCHKMLGHLNIEGMLWLTNQSVRHAALQTHSTHDGAPNSNVSKVADLHKGVKNDFEIQTTQDQKLT